MNGNMAEDGGLAEDGIVKQVEYIFVDQLNNKSIQLVQGPKFS